LVAAFIPGYSNSHRDRVESIHKEVHQEVGRDTQGAWIILFGFNDQTPPPRLWHIDWKGAKQVM